MTFQTWESLRTLHIEITTMCNAVCPGCARYPTQSYFKHPSAKKDSAWTIEETILKLPKEDLKEIYKVYINGSFGDFIANPDALEIARYFKSCCKSVEINSNGSTRSEEFWKELGALGVEVNFALDGLADTHARYRRETDFNTIIGNAKTFIAAGGRANWIMTVFEHNMHQTEQCKQMAADFNFASFSSRPNNRGQIYVFDKNNQFVEELLPPTVSNTKKDSLNKPIYSYKKEDLLRSGKRELNNQVYPLGQISCHSIGSLYITGDWHVVPCCFIGNSMLMPEISTYNDTVKQYPNLNEIVHIKGKDKTVRQAWEEMNNWKKLFEAMNTENTFEVCKKHCTVSGSFNVGRTETVKSTTT